MEEKNIVLETLSKVDKVFEGIKFLITFLHDKRDINRGTNSTILNYFMLNVRNIPKMQSTETTWEKIKENGDTKNAIITAFDWDLSPEGYEYWDEIDKEFRKAFAEIIHNGFRYNVILENDIVMQEFKNTYITPFEPKDTQKKPKVLSCKYFPPTTPITFKEGATEEVNLLNGITSYRDNPTSIKVVPTVLTEKFMRFLSPSCTDHQNKQIDIFNQVLDDNHCKNEYYANLRNKPKYHGYETQFKDYLDNKDLRGIVYWSFNWVTTKEGIPFWSDIASKVEIALKKEFTNGYGVTRSFTFPARVQHDEPKPPMLPSQQRGLVYNPYAYGYSDRPNYMAQSYETHRFVDLPKEILNMPICKNLTLVLKKEVEVEAF